MSCGSRTSDKVAQRGAPASGVPPAASRAAQLAGQTRLGVLPTVQAEAVSRNYGRYSIGPLPVGAGVTLGNALRRTLLASVKGAALTSVKLDGLPHEFSTIPHVREDMTALMLNLKGVRLRFRQDKPAQLRLRARGEGPVKAGDLQLPPHVEVVNPDHDLFFGDSAETDVSLTLTARSGYGYAPAEERPRSAAGEISLDAIFSPLKKANFRVIQSSVAENARLGQPFERLGLEVETDGSLSPEQAVRQAAGTLAGQFGLLAAEPWDSRTGPPETGTIYRRPLASLGFQPRTLNALQRGGLTQVNQVMQRLRRSPREVRGLAGLGRKSYGDLLATLSRQALSDGDRYVLNVLRQEATP